MADILDPTKLRNVAIIAHVDHGKTTLVDELLKQSGTFRDNESVAERAMDSMDLERERGITIAAKNTAIRYEDYKINIVDTPGHADFGGEVERILGMVDGCCLLVDAAEGPLPQTRFVLEKALKRGLKVLVVINKIDRGDARPEEVLSEVFNLFIDLDATEEQCDFPYIFAVARDGKAFKSLEDYESSTSLKPLFDEIVRFMPPPAVKPDGKLQILISNLGYSDYLGRLAIGRVSSGNIKVGQTVAIIGVKPGTQEPKAKNLRVQALFSYHGLKQVPVEEGISGDIVVLAGVDEVELGDSIVEVPGAKSDEKWDPISLALPRLVIDEPTLKVEWMVNSSPLAGQEGDHVTSSKLKERLHRELRLNVALRLQETDSADKFVIMARGELQVAILAETMRREGYEFSIGQPQIMFKEIDGVMCEPMEHAILDVPMFSQGTITQMFQMRKGILQNISSRNGDRVRLEFLIPSRGLIGLRSKFLTETKGEGLLNFSSAGYEPLKGDLVHRLNGSLVSDRAGESNAYALETLQERGILFIGIQTKVYEGMIIGENAKENDLNVNPVKAKQLTNFRTVNKDDAIVLTPPRLVTIENALEWIREDELLEVTPKNIRARKRILSKNRPT
jgi:GTP-binding protein